MLKLFDPSLILDDFVQYFAYLLIQLFNFIIFLPQNTLQSPHFLI